MFRILVKFGVCVVVLTMGITLGVNSLLAAEEEAIQEEQSFIIGEYFVCDVTRETFADVLVEKALGPILANLTGGAGYAITMVVAGGAFCSQPAMI